MSHQMSYKNCVLLIFTICFFVLSGFSFYFYFRSTPCYMNKENCVDDPRCKCWCSWECNYRNKKADDQPIHVPNDPNKRYCYCKPRDLEFYHQKCDK